MYQLVQVLATQMKDVFPELAAQEAFVSRVILEEERSFLRTLEGGLKRLDQVEITQGKLDGALAFRTIRYIWFPIDLTRLIGREKGFDVDELGFEAALATQKSVAICCRQKTGDWEILVPGTNEVVFIGYDHLEADNAKILKYRHIEDRRGAFYQIVLDKTPFIQRAAVRLEIPHPHCQRWYYPHRGHRPGK